MVGLIASRVTIVQYRLMLTFSLRDDPMMAQLIIKNIVLLTSILILTYGLHVPKTWHRAVLVAGPLALLPFATLSVLYLRHPEAMGWLGRGWGPTIPNSRARSQASETGQRLESRARTPPRAAMTVASR
jgi:serine/threonine-protein kinase